MKLLVSAGRPKSKYLKKFDKYVICLQPENYTVCSNRGYYLLTVHKGPKLPLYAINGPKPSLSFKPYDKLRIDKEQEKQPIEVLGGFDPLPNRRNELVCGFKFDRLHYWLNQGARVSHLNHFRIFYVKFFY